MNVERLQILRDFIDGLPSEQFEMGDWITPRRRRTRCGEAISCGTVACLAGWAVILASDPDYVLHGRRSFWSPWKPLEIYADSIDIEDTAMDWLGLTDNEAYQLFYGHWPEGDPMKQSRDVQKRMALRRLDALMRKAKKIPEASSLVIQSR